MKIFLYTSKNNLKIKLKTYIIFIASKYQLVGVNGTNLYVYNMYI